MILFMNKLNRVDVPDIPIFNIVGTGCQMKQGEGDGVVLKDNVLLDKAKNYIVKGSCKGINFLHTELLDIDKYPEVYKIIKDILTKDASVA